MKERIIAEIDVNQIKENIKSIRNIVGDKKVFVTVKANAYGHGIVECGKYFEEFGIDALCVASFDEALELRDHGIKCQILILATVPDDKNLIAEGIEKDISFSISSNEFVDSINSVAISLNKKANCHVKVDTGMSRIGVAYDNATDFIKYVKTLSNINLAGVFSHLSSSDDEEDDMYTQEQISKMTTLKSQINDDNIIYHLANSAAILKYPSAHFDAVRTGILLYGYSAYKDVSKAYNIKPVLKLKSHIIHIKEVKENTSIGYNRTYVSTKHTRVATVSAGYGDGYPRALSNKGYVIINGKKAKIIGRICMDLFMVDITDIDAKPWDDVTLYDSNYEETNIENIASKINTISYELLTQISARVKRVYLK